MTIEEIVTILKNRLMMLSTARQAAVDQGDLAQITTIDSDIAETTTSLAKLGG